MIDQLLPVFYNYTRSLEMLYLLEGLKPTVRLDANEAELQKLKQFCREKELALEVSDFKVAKIPDIGKGGYVNKIKRVPHSFSRGLYHIYVAQNKNRAAMLKFVEQKQDDRAFGQLLGYPSCCVEFFLKHQPIQQHRQNDYLVPTIKNSEGFSFHFLTNYGARYFDVTLLSHFPHSFHCGDSLTQAQKRLECIKKHSPELAARFEGTLKSPIIYTETNGIFVLQNHTVKRNVISYERVLGTIKNKLYDHLAKNREIKIVGKNNITVRNQLVEAHALVFTSSIRAPASH